MPERPLVPPVLARGSRGAVVSPHHLASTAGLAILRAGGSAVDAAIATNAVLAVVVPEACGIGGDAFWLIWDAAAGRQVALNGSGRAAAAADATALRQAGLERLPKRGPLSITVPGAVRSWADAHRRFGRLPVGAILAPAIDLAAAASRPGTASSTRSRPWPGSWVATRGRRRVGQPSIDRSAGRGDLVNESASRRSPRRSSSRPRRLRRLLRRRAGRAAGPRAGGGGLADHGRRPARPHLDVGRAARHRLPRRPGHDPPAEQPGHRRRSSCSTSSSTFEPPPRRCFGPTGVTDARWIHLGIEAAKLAMADRDTYLTDPAVARDPGRAPAGQGLRAELAARIDPARAALPPAADHPAAAGRSTSPWSTAKATPSA